VNNQVVIHALTVAALQAANGGDDLPLATTFSRACNRLDSIGQEKPVALRLEMAHYEQILEHGSKGWGPENTGVLTFSNSLALSYSDLGRTAEAVQLNEETLAIQQQVLGVEHPDTFSSCNNLALSYHYLTRHQEAVQLHEETLAIRERVLGPEHPDTLQSRNSLALGYHYLRRHQEAVQLDEETLE
jgi:tetratricopeptide (TPR) repeat protein